MRGSLKPAIPFPIGTQMRYVPMARPYPPLSQNLHKTIKQTTVDVVTEVFFLCFLFLSEKEKDICEYPHFSY